MFVQQAKQIEMLSSSYRKVWENSLSTDRSASSLTDTQVDSASPCRLVSCPVSNFSTHREKKLNNSLTTGNHSFLFSILIETQVFHFFSLLFLHIQGFPILKLRIVILCPPWGDGTFFMYTVIFYVSINHF